MTDAATPTSPSPTAAAETLVRHDEGGVATLRINRPEAFNALDRTTKEALVATLRAVAEDDSVRVVVLTGTGKSFCAGEDLRAHAGNLLSGEQTLANTIDDHYNPIAETLATMDKPVIAAINGIAAGAGVAFALAADFRIMTDDGGMNLAFAGIALSCDSGASFWLPRIIGMAKAKEVLLMPSTLSAADCERLGLVTRVVSRDEFDGVVAELAGKLAVGPTRAYGAMRRALAFSATHDLIESLKHERDLMDSTGRTADHLGAVQSFVAKQRPTFTGR
ncbi:MAG: enoyl-CoA hydratase/isomerase family protein [Dermatophilaceae bacterium]|nr:enoyl-CoA hydratase/isomerase family protein [Dermatophilaceae bacterium]